jgi:hypothetical protein
MWCCKCNRDLGECVCPDLAERLASLAKSPHLALSSCKVCGKYQPRCICADGPTTQVVLGGEHAPEPKP